MEKKEFVLISTIITLGTKAILIFKKKWSIHLLLCNETTKEKLVDRGK